MRSIALIIFLAMATALFAGNGKLKRELVLEELQSVIEFLAADELEGRAPGTRGGSLSELYMQSLFKFMGLRAPFSNGYRQEIRLIAAKTESAGMSVGKLDLKNFTDFVLAFPARDGGQSFEKELLYCGFGIRAPQYSWDDYARGDFRDKVLIVRVGDPGLYDSTMFNGDIMSYFGRWIYKIEEASRLGAAGVLFIHTDASASYGWSVVQNSWQGESLYLPDQDTRKLLFYGWISEQAFSQIAAREGWNPQTLYKKSMRPGFVPMKLKARVNVTGESRQREFSCSNIVGQIPGKSPKQIVVSAHIDHLGMADGNGADRIFNGAIDNGSAVAAMVMVAKLLSENYPEPNYTITFLACQAEEGGLLGSRYFARNCDPDSVILNINFESSPVWEKSSSVMAIGAEYMNLEGLARKVAGSMGYGYDHSSLLKKALYYRSDQFSFSRYNIPGIWVSAGEDFAGKSKMLDFFNTDYHTVRDEFNPHWKLTALAQTAEYAFALLREIDMLMFVPKLKEKVPFPVEQSK